MSRLITYVPSQSSKHGEYAFDEDGERLSIEFGWFATQDAFDEEQTIPKEIESFNPQRTSYVSLDGVIHRCSDIEFSMGVIVFWAEPAIDAMSFDEWQKQKPLAGVSVATGQPNIPFAEWLRKNGAEVNGSSD